MSNTTKKSDNESFLTKACSPFYDQYWQAGGVIGYRDRWDWVADYIKEGRQVLDIGCGPGITGESLIKKGCEVTGIDVCGDILVQAQKKGIKTLHLNSMSQNIDLPTESFDYIILSCILEHVIDPELILLRAQQLLKLSGEIIVVVPNIAYITHRLSLLLGRFPRQWVHHPKEHYLYWNQANEFEDHILEKIPSLYVKSKDTCHRNSKVYHPLKKKAMDAFAKIHPNLFGYYNILILGKRKELIQ